MRVRRDRAESNPPAEPASSSPHAPVSDDSTDPARQDRLDRHAAGSDDPVRAAGGDTRPAQGGWQRRRERLLRALGVDGLISWEVLLVGLLVLVAGASVAAVLGVASVDPDTSPASDEKTRSALTASPPAELPRVGSSVDGRVARDGRVVVTHWIRQSVPLGAIEVQRPVGALGSGPIRLGSVNVSSDGSLAAGSRDGAAGAGRFLFDEPARQIRLRYTLSGALLRSPSVPGRALVRTAAAPVVADAPLKGPVVVTLRAPKVLSMACVGPDQLVPTPRPCGAPVKGGWRVTLRGDDRRDQVQAQVDLQD